MGDKTGIEWTEATWNAIAGCSVVSKGCKNCYAMKVAHRLAQIEKTAGKYGGLTQVVNGNIVWNGELRLDEQALLQPLKWTRARLIFVNSMSDLFHENVPDAWIDRVFGVMARCPHHTFQILTKRAARMREYMKNLPNRQADFNCDAGLDGAVFPLPNVWLGVSVEDQPCANERIPLLIDTPAAVRFLSCEPLLEPVDLTKMPFAEGDERHTWDALTGQALMFADGVDGHPDMTIRLDKPIYPHIDWVIVGGESGPGARAMQPEWARSLRDQCVRAGVKFHFKQWGEWMPEPDLASEWQEHYELLGQWEGVCRRVGKKAAGRMLDGRTWDEMPGVAA